MPVAPLAPEASLDQPVDAASCDVMCLVKRRAYELASAVPPIFDIGCGLGGPARCLVQRVQCRLSGIDITKAFVMAAKKLTRPLSMDNRGTIRYGDGRGSSLLSPVGTRMLLEEAGFAEMAMDHTVFIHLAAYKRGWPWQQGEPCCHGVSTYSWGKPHRRRRGTRRLACITTMSGERRDDTCATQAVARS
jgi:SAM-dependent methyltransferase